MKTTRLRMDACPSCGHKMDAATSIHGYTPSPGDISVCMYCRSVNTFDDNLYLKTANLNDLPSYVQRQVAEIQDAMLNDRSGKKDN